MNRILCIFLAFLAFAILNLVAHASFDSTFSDDVDFNYGKHRKRNKRKKESSFLRKYFFLYIKLEVKKWHYICFWINYASTFSMLIGMIMYYIKFPNIDNKFGYTSRYILLISSIVYFLSLLLGGILPYASFYNNWVKGTKSKKPYRKNSRNK